MGTLNLNDFLSIFRKYIIVMLNIENIPLLALYAEIHFKFFPLFPSFLFRKQPEIIFDCPRRIGPGIDLPISLTIHDCSRFPVELTEVAISVSGTSFPVSVYTFTSFNGYEITHSLQPNLRGFLFPIPRKKLTDGEIHINAKAVFKDRKNRENIIFNDNIPTSSKLSFNCKISSEPLPASQICGYGDFHVHSSFSESHVEFGPPIELISRMATASGLNFINITDHSYDLACTLENYLINDTSRKRWQTCLIESEKEYPTIVMHGEEVSCLNSRNQVVHLCGADLTSFIPGSLDGARGNPEKTHQFTIQETVEEIHHQGGIAFAAHPGSQKTLMQSIFLRRGQWDENDCNGDLDGFQAYNGSFSRSWRRALILWIDMLKKGFRVPLLAGNDAHGDFNRYRSIETPFFSIFESSERYFGNGKTGIYGICTNKQDVISAVKSGKTFVTSGPYLSINDDTSETSMIVNRTGVSFESTSFFVHCVSNLEFGRMHQLTVYGLKGSEKNERIISKKEFHEIHYTHFVPVKWDSQTEYHYIRAELHTITECGKIHKAFSSCCFNNSSPT
jgi:hypothetical protein